jgi:Uncharacterized conserved protein (DUF2190)
MPYSVDYKRGVYVTNGSGGTYTHGAPVKEGNFVGIAVKQKAATFDAGLAAHSLIQISENYFLITKGEVQVANVSGFAKGDKVYITSANVLTETGASNTPFGRVTETTSDNRGVPTGKVRIDLDVKTAVAADTF